MSKVQLFTDGACKGNPGPGGWGFILRHPATGREIEGSGGEKQTTNNRMELTAVIEGLKVLKNTAEVEIISDSKYVLQGLTEWLPNWKRNGWKRREGSRLRPVQNTDLWQELDGLASLHKITVQHVLGHQGHPENERCDQLANKGAAGNMNKDT
ncbi:ribonuclease H [Planctomycetales bacterium]|nr:ribonuclease H [Planctomycetales bacterium]